MLILTCNNNEMTIYTNSIVVTNDKSIITDLGVLTLDEESTRKHIDYNQITTDSIFKLDKEDIDAVLRTIHQKQLPTGYCVLRGYYSFGCLIEYAKENNYVLDDFEITTTKEEDRFCTIGYIVLFTLFIVVMAIALLC